MNKEEREAERKEENLDVRTLFSRFWKYFDYSEQEKLMLQIHYLFILASDTSNIFPLVKIKEQCTVRTINIIYAAETPFKLYEEMVLGNICTHIFGLSIQTLRQNHIPSPSCILPAPCNKKF